MEIILITLDVLTRFIDKRIGLNKIKYIYADRIGIFSIENTYAPVEKRIINNRLTYCRPNLITEGDIISTDQYIYDIKTSDLGFEYTHEGNVAKIVKILVEDGDEVAKGQPLIQIELI
jgi:hypothetical protein